MTGVEVANLGLSSTKDLLKWYLGDLSDKDLQFWPTQDANNIAWQVGHLIASERFLLSILPGATYPELPAAFDGLQAGASAKSKPDGGGLTKAEYVRWFETIRDASIANVARLMDADLDKPNTGPLAQFAPTLGALIVTVAHHTLMHGGQFTVIRRMLGKPVLF
jgi:hypothetical protein